MKEKSFERKEALLDAALDEFINNPYDDASLNTIIKNANISKGTFYYHFENKQALYLDLLKTAFHAKWTFIFEQTQESDNLSENTIFDKFLLQARFGMQFAKKFPKYGALSNRFSRSKNSPIYEIAKEHIGIESGKMLENMVQKSITDGDFSPNYPAEFIIKVVCYLFNHYDEIVDMENEDDLDRIYEKLESFVKFMKDGLGK